MRIYFDNCCLNRPYDDLTLNTVRMECEAILSIIDNCAACCVSGTSKGRCLSDY